MKIGELAEKTQTPVQTIRFYEREGLLPAPRRTESNYRAYDSVHADRLLFIRHCRALDMALDEIRVLLRYKDRPDEDCTQVNDLLDDHIGHVAQRIKDLRGLEKQLRDLRASCKTSQDAQHCGILNGLSATDGTSATRPLGASAHVHGAHARVATRPAADRRGGG